MKHFNLKNVIYGLYSIFLGYSLGHLLLYTIPGMEWPHYVIADYTLGLLASLFISFELFRKWQRPVLTKAITALILLGVVFCVSHQLSAMQMVLVKMQLAEMYP